MAIEVIYICTTTLIKLSILCFYRRLTSSAISRRLLIIIWISIIFVAAYGISSTLALIFHCNPVEAYWYRFTTSWLRTHTYKCVDEAAFLLAVISISTAQDFLACMLPMFVVHKLRLPLRQKLALAAIFLTGLAVCAIGALRVHFAHKLVYYTRINPSPTYDITWDAMPSWVATSAEANIALVCASAPALKIYFNKWLNTSGVRPRSFGWYKPMGRASRSTSGRERGGWTFMKYAAADPEPDSGYGSMSLQSRVKGGSGVDASFVEERREDCGEDISPHEHVTVPSLAHTR
ncbi:hypothetical protein FB567DRAFT_58213 [Paraphoma chrysanthemicola]|uniref:Rhodopsin domain-containing protein n=1 Tax=Paraphoma chrysanthemicola TaxID=798071 RepID=A0A8K0R587_9PLEO|nr:hypothetical protein FB567DRAFT_58213 [Paraphoma chrysanthemicola]